MNILIKNGTIVTSQNTYQLDILLKDGIISAIGDIILNDETIDFDINAKGFYIFPGGVDPHVHMHLTTAAGYTSDNFDSGAKAALSGGTTSLIDFVTPKRGQSIIEALHLRKEDAKNSQIEYEFHVSPVEWDENTEKEILHCIEKEGIKSFKVYMAYKNNIGLDDKDIFKVMQVVGKAGGIVTVHAELGDEIERLRNQFAENGNISPQFHPLSRLGEMESEAVKKVIEMAAKANCPVYIVHVSTKESIDYIRKAQQIGQKVYAETCPHYLLLDDSNYIGNFDQTSPFVISPPLRKKADQEALWKAIADGTIRTIGTDHCPFNLSQKRFGIDDFRKIPNGAGGVEHRLALLYTFGVLQNRLTLNRFVDLVSTSPAKIFNLYPKKGEIAIGSDADLVIWNPKAEQTISVKTHHQNCDNDIFEGFKTIGKLQYVILKGEIYCDNSKK